MVSWSVIYVSRQYSSVRKIGDHYYEYGGALMLNQFTSFLAIVTLSSTMSAGVVRGAWALCFIVVLLCLAVILL